MELDWSALVALQEGLAEDVLRATVVYLGVFFIFRLTLRRQTGELGMTNILLMILIANSTQNALIGDSRSIGDAFVLVGTIIGWSVLLDWLGYRIPRLQRLLQAPPLLLVAEGRPVRRNLRRELMTEEELLAQLRLQGVRGFEEVRAAYMESDGRISVIPYERQAPAAPERRT